MPPGLPVMNARPPRGQNKSWWDLGSVSRATAAVNRMWLVSWQPRADASRCTFVPYIVWTSILRNSGTCGPVDLIFFVVGSSNHLTLIYSSYNAHETYMGKGVQTVKKLFFIHFHSKVSLLHSLICSALSLYWENALKLCHNKVMQQSELLCALNLPNALKCARMTCMQFFWNTTLHYSRTDTCVNKMMLLPIYLFVAHLSPMPDAFVLFWSLFKTHNTQQ